MNELTMLNPIFKKYQIYRKIVKEGYVFYKLSLFKDWKALHIITGADLPRNEISF